jgi:DNA-binding PadR family transcriptional regulator
MVLKDGSMRFNELRRLLQNVSQKMLTQTLRHLEEDGFITREVIPTVPVTVSYELTPLGRVSLRWSTNYALGLTLIFLKSSEQESEKQSGLLRYRPSS